MKIRSITLFSDITIPIKQSYIAELGTFAQAARDVYADAGFEVQTTRLATHLFPKLMQSEWATCPVPFITKLERMCQEQGFEFIALGPAKPEYAPYLPEIFAATQTVFATMHIVNPVTGSIHGEAIKAAASVIRQASTIEEGFGNLRFAALANVPAGIPFFPAAYYEGTKPSFAIATESADLALAACQKTKTAAAVHQALEKAITQQAKRMVIPAEELAQTYTIPFGGIDFSLAPFPNPKISIGAALEALSGQPLGAAGTLAAAATLTSAIDAAEFPHTGFCGMMLPVLEDLILAQRAAEGHLRIGELLQWSAVCGTGLDTVPLPGNVSKSAVSRLLFDVAALSSRLHKPLTARLMPLPGKVAGDPVHFDFAYFADGGVLALNGTDEPGLLSQTSTLHLETRAT